MSAVTGRHVLAVLPQTAAAPRVLEAAVAAVEPGGWLTLAVPIALSRSQSVALLAGISAHPAELERQALTFLEASMPADASRVHGVVLHGPLVDSVPHRVAVAHHDLVVMPGAWRDCWLRYCIRARMRVPMIAVQARPAPRRPAAERTGLALLAPQGPADG